MKFKNTFLTLAILASLLSTSCSSTPAEAPKFDVGSNPEEISARISEIGEVSLEKENMIEAIYIDYCGMNEVEQAKVENLDVLQSARDEIAKLYNTEEKDGERIDRSKILTGVYCFNTRTEERLQWVKEAGIDIIIGAPYDMEFLDLLQKYEMGAFLSYLPGWYGGNSDIAAVIAGTMAAQIPSGSYNSYAESFVDHPAIWAMDVGDEPSSQDIPHYGVMIEEAKALFPGKLIFLNLYPNHASRVQQGVDTYQEYIDIFDENVNTDYLSYDFYNIVRNNSYLDKTTTHGRNMINWRLLSHVENLRIAANACRDEGIDLWTVIQAGANSYLNDHITQDYITKGQTLSQIYAGMTFGTKAFFWACWEDGWNDAQTNMVNSAGEKTPSYYSVQYANEKLKELSPVYMKYTNTDAAFFGDTDQLTNLSYIYLVANDDSNPEELFDFMSYDDNKLDQNVFTNINVTRDDAIILAGSFVKNSGDGSAMMFANVSDFGAYGNFDGNIYENTYNTEITFKVNTPNAKVYIYHTDYTSELVPDENGVYSFELMNTQGAFVTVHSEQMTEETAE